MAAPCIKEQELPLKDPLELERLRQQETSYVIAEDTLWLSTVVIKSLRILCRKYSLLQVLPP
jgi:hypothetical protein